jgi:hypothetical protein
MTGFIGSTLRRKFGQGYRMPDPKYTYYKAPVTSIEPISSVVCQNFFIGYQSIPRENTIPYLINIGVSINIKK